jgi:glycolate oxidase iron-sulfur subunit
VTRAFGEEMYYCLGCLACTTACPAGVDYAKLFETARAEVERQGSARHRQRARCAGLRCVSFFTRPRLLRFIGRLLWLWQRSGLQALSRSSGLTRLLPGRLAGLEPQAPRIQTRFSDGLIAPVERPRDGQVRHRVALLTGCVQDLVFSDVNRATVDVLLANGCEVITPRVQSCCGSLHAHNGDTASARELARRQLDAIDPGSVDAIISNAGGCGSHLRHYDHLLHDDPAYAERAAEWSRKLRDIHEWLAEIKFRPPTAPVGGAPAFPVTYHESCHLCHGQKVSRQPREILKSLPGASCANAAKPPGAAAAPASTTSPSPKPPAGSRRARSAMFKPPGATVVATANPGCHLQIVNGLRGTSGENKRVTHPIVLLAEAYRAEVRSSP